MNIDPLYLNDSGKVKGRSSSAALEAAAHLNCSNLDRVLHRVATVSRLKADLLPLSGTLLDVGYGKMPYKSLLVSGNSGMARHTSMDLPGNTYGEPNLAWDGVKVPMSDGAVNCTIATKLLKHSPELQPGLACSVLRGDAR